LDARQSIQLSHSSFGTQGSSKVSRFIVISRSDDGPNCEEFLEAMRMEISELESQNCWDVIVVNNVPEGKKVLPTMWFFKIIASFSSILQL
jgi:hypothetical protein